MPTLEIKEIREEEVLDRIEVEEKPEVRDRISDPNSECFLIVKDVSPTTYSYARGEYRDSGEYSVQVSIRNGEWVGSSGGLFERFLG